jgi:hypothetical protein
MQVRQTLSTAALVAWYVVAVGCTPGPDASEGTDIAARLAQYATVELGTDMAVLTDRERAMLPLLIEAAERMTDLF